MNNNITRHSHTNCVHNVIKRMNKHIKHITNYGMGINLYNKKPRNKQMISVTSTMVSLILEKRNHKQLTTNRSNE